MAAPLYNGGRYDVVRFGARVYNLLEKPEVRFLDM